MQDRDIFQLWLMCAKKWPRLFELPVPIERDPTDRAVMLEVWQGTIGDLDPKAVKAALMEWRGQYPPNVGEIREAVMSLSERTTGSGLPTVDQAWTELLTAVQRIGAYGGPVWSHPCIEQAVEAIGYKAFCASAIADVGTWRAQFRDFYATICARFQRDTRQPTPALVAYTGSQVVAGAMRAIRSAKDEPISLGDVLSRPPKDAEEE